jgi:hypothetical protein
MMSHSVVLALRIVLVLGLCARAAHSSDAGAPCDVVAELSCGDGVRLIAEGPTLPFKDPEKLTAANREEWERLWHYLGLPAPFPVVDFRADIVAAWVYTASECREAPPRVVVCRNGQLGLRRRPPVDCTVPLHSAPRPRWVWIAAISRSRLASTGNQGIDTDHDDEERLDCTPDIAPAELKARERAWRSVAGHRSWFDTLRWSAAVGAIGGYSPSRGGLFGGELRTGLRDDIGIGAGEGFLGNLVGVDLRARFLNVPNDARPSLFMLGLWPWMMMSHDWVFQRSFSRQPTFMTLIVPEAGIVLDGGLDAYLYWSFPIMLRQTTYFYRSSPYVVREHVAFEFAPGVLWRPSPRSRDLAFTLSLSIGLW